MDVFVPALNAFRFYNDDGNDTDDTAVAAQDTNITRLESSPTLHLRLLVQATTAVAGGLTDDWQLQVSKNAGAYANVTTTSSNVKAFDSSFLTDPGSLSTRKLTGGTGTATSIISEDGLADDRPIAASGFCEFLYTVELVVADLIDADTLDFRLLLNGATFTYNVTPRVTVSAGANLTPALFTNTQTFHAPTVTVGAVTLTPSLFTNSQTFFAPTVSVEQFLTPSLFTNSQTFHTPAVAAVLTASLFTNSQSFFSPTVAPGAVTLTPSLFTNAQTFFSPTVAQPVQTLLPSLFTNSNTFPSATVSTSYTLTPVLFTNTQTFFAPAVAASYALTPALFTNSNSFPSPAVSASYTLTPALFTNTQIFYSPTVTVPPQEIEPGLFSNSQTFYPMAVWADYSGGSGSWTPGSPPSDTWTPIPPMTDNWS